MSDCASGVAGFDGMVIEGGERKVITGSIGCPKVHGVKVGSRIPDRSRQAMSRHPPLI